VVTIANAGDAPVAMLWNNSQPLVVSNGYSLDDGTGVGEGGWPGDGPADGAQTCLERQDLALVAAYGHKTRRIAIRVPDAYRGHLIELNATLELVLWPFDRPCGQLHVIEKDVTAVCEPRR